MKNESLCIPARSVLGFLNNGLVLPRIQLRRRQWQPTPVLLPGKSHGQRSLVGFSPWGCEESDTTERLHFHFSLSCIGEGNGNLLQCSCLGNLGGGAWWAAVYGVAQSRTRLKWLSSSNRIQLWGLSASNPHKSFIKNVNCFSGGVPVSFFKWGKQRRKETETLEVFTLVSASPSSHTCILSP